MMYTKKDVIVWEDDERLEGLQEGDEIWTGDNYRWLLEKANNNRMPDQFVCVDTTCDNTFVFKASYGISAAPFMIIKKKQVAKKEIIPFDFSKKKDRDAMMGKRIVSDDEDLIITHLSLTGYGYWIEDSTCLTSEDFFNRGWVFADTGKPVGKEIEE